MLADGHRSIGLEVKLDTQERAWGTEIIQLELCFQCSLHLLYLVRDGCSNEEAIDVDTDHATGCVEHTVVRLCHGEAMSGQDAVDALVRNPRSLLESIQGTMKAVYISWLFDAFG